MPALLITALDSPSPSKGDLVHVFSFFLGMLQELSSNSGSRQSLGREVMSLVAQDSHELRRQRIVQQLDDVLAPRTIVRDICAVLQTFLGTLERDLVELQSRTCTRG